MNRKQLGILLGLAVVIGGAGLLMYHRNEQSWNETGAATGGTLLGKLPVNDITHLVIRQSTNELNLAKQDETWRVRERHDYPANFSQISEFLLKARDWKIVQTEKIGPSQLPKLQLAPPGPGSNTTLAVEFRGAGDKAIATLLVGKPHLRKSARPSQFGEGDEGFPDGRYVKTADSDTVAVISDPLENVQPRPENWLNKDFLKVEKARSLQVIFPVATNSWKLTRATESGEWILADAKPTEKLDSSKTSALSSPLGSPSFTDVLAGDKLAGSGTNAPIAVTVETFDDFHYAFNVGAKTNDEYPLTVTLTAELAKERTPSKDEKPADKDRLDKEFQANRQKLADKLKQEQTYQGWTYLVSSWSVDSLLKERAQLLVEKKDEPKADGTNTTATVEAPKP